MTRNLLPGSVCLAAFLAAAAFAVPAAAQTTWIVDGQNGPGTSFTTLTDAMDAAAPNDLILVRPGLYRGARVRKPLRIVGGPGVTLSAQALDIVGIGAGETFSISGFHLSMGAQTAGITMQTCGGAIHLQDITGDWTSPIRSRWCDYVALSGQMTHFYSLGGHIALSGVTIVGNSEGNPAVSILSGEVTVTDSNLTGAQSSPLHNSIARGPGVGLHASNSTVRLSGTVALTAGPRTGVNMKSVPGLDATDSDVILDPGVTLTGTGMPGLRVTGGSQTWTSVPGLRVTGGQLGQSMQVQLSATPATSCAIALAVGDSTQSTASLGMLVIGRSSSHTLAFGTTAAAGRFGTSLPLPGNPALRGLPIHFQGVVLTSQILLTTPASVILN